jgi:hypothetical protein
MKNLLKILLVVIVFSFFNLHTFAQPAKGIKVGANYTLYKDSNGIDYTGLPGFQLGYAWSTKLNESLALSIEGLFTQKSSNVKYVNEEYVINIDEKRNAMYISAPIGLNYCFTKVYVGGGYEFGYLISGNLPVNEIDHALFLQAAYKIRIMDINLKYGASLNKETGGTVVGGGNYQGNDGSSTPPITTYTPKANTLQLSLIFNLGKK